MAGPNDASVSNTSSSSSSSGGSSSSFPAKEVLLTAGTGFFLGMFYFYKRKKTLPFKVCYGMMWPTLGGGIMLAVTPSREEMAQRLEQSRAVTSEDLRKQRVANTATVEAMAKQYAGQQR
eukprot:GHRQ01031625.1.p1 GENE.GHRQ01031625.1~~GHRQ01031625.1.p1  ORF type:complete len:133 (+),score=46.83 GHRQ01031625.1:42-401(+)